jgi:hypothetical protein
MATRKLGEPTMDFREQVASNEFTFMELLKKMRPDLWVLADVMDNTKINYLILLKLMYHLNNIATGSKYGDVKVQIQNGICTFIFGEESSRVNEPVIKLESTNE